MTQPRHDSYPEQPSVTVVIPTHKRPQLVRRAVQGVMDQTYGGSVEVVVVFDNAEPHPIAVEAPEGRDLRVLVNNERTPGLAGARNTGILAAQGQYVAFCDDDDYWLPPKLGAQFALLAQYGSEAVVATGITTITEGRRRVRLPPVGPLTMTDFLRDRIMEVHPSTLLLRRDVLTKIGLVDEDLPFSYAEDYDLLLRASRALPVVSVAQPLVAIEFQSGSFYAAQWRVILAGLGYLLDKYPEFADVPKGRARIQGQMAFAHAALGERRQALRFIGKVLRSSPAEQRAYAALAVLAGVPAASVVALARRLGRGI